MKIKFSEIPSKHPLFTAVGIAATAFLAAFGAARWECQVQQKSVAVQTDTTALAWQKEKSALEKQVQDLQRTAVTLPITIGDQKSFLDVRKLLLAPGDVPSLGNNFRSFGYGRFFADVPALPAWNYSESDDVYMWSSPTRIPFTRIQRFDKRAISDTFTSLGAR